VPRARWARRLLLLLVVLGLLYAGLVFGERLFIYFPTRELSETPADAGLEFDDATFEADDGVKLHGWWVPGRTDEVTLLWFHGNAGNLGDRVGLLELLHDELGIGIFAIDYRGYGRSEGKPSETGLYADARAALEAAQNYSGSDAEEIVIFGQSLGAAVAVELANSQPVRGVVLEAAFTSIRDMARHHYSFLPVGALLRTSFDSESKIARIDTPLLMIHGQNDDIVPLDMGRKLFAAAEEPKEFSQVEGAGHNDVYLREEFTDTLKSFLNTL
jgi:fermentation-respiration switch protein FrsA (DUF1100 family)